MIKSDLTALTVAELKALAKKRNVSLPAGAKKSEIIDVLTLSSTVEKPAAKRAAVAKKPAAGKTVRAEKSAAGTKAPVKRVRTGKLPEAAARVREWKMPPAAEGPLMAQERVSESKYYTGPEQQPAVATYGDLPQGYGEDKIALLSRDPFVAYAYWEATQARLEREKAWFGLDSKLCARIYDITGVQFDGRNAVAYFDQELFERIGNWYFDLGRPSHSFCVDLGLLTPDGRFLTLARSNYITMPRDSVSDVVDDEWMLLDEEFMKLYGVPSGLSSPQLQELVKRRRMLEITSPGMFSRPKAKRK